MAVRHDITRTITFTVIEGIFLDESKDEVVKTQTEIPKLISSERDIKRYYEKNPNGLTFVKGNIIGTRDVLYGMSNDTFVKYGEIMEMRKVKGE